MTVGLWDCVHVKNILEHVNDFSDTTLVAEQIEKLHWKRKPMSSVVNILAQALYALFSAGDDPDLVELQNACFSYFHLGGRCVSTPAGLLAGFVINLMSRVIPSPLTLVGHFFAVAFYAVYLMLARNPLMFPIVFFRCIAVIWKACKVIVPVLISEIRQ
jgi:squalene monooxygenase